MAITKILMTLALSMNGKLTTKLSKGARFMWALLLYATFFLQVLPAQAYEKEVAEAVAYQELQAKYAGNEVLHELEAYRGVVEKAAYRDTIKLCEGYRRTFKLGPSPYFGEFQHSRKYTRIAWLKLAKEGALQSFSVIFGLKADYNTEKMSPAISYDAWFNSLYQILLLNSPGYRQASNHCFPGTSTDAKTNREKFARAIILVDNGGTAVSSFVGGGAVFKIVTKALKPLLKPLGKVLAKPMSWTAALFTKRVRRTALVAGIAVSGFALYQWHRFLEDRNDQVLGLFDEESEEYGESQQIRRRVILQSAVRRFHPLFQSAKEQEESAPMTCEQAKEHYASFTEFVEQQIDPRMIQDFEEDLENLNKMSLDNEVPEDQASYHALLKGFFPIMKEFYEDKDKACPAN